MKSISDIIFAVQNCRMDAIGLKKICVKCPYRGRIDCIYDLKDDIVEALQLVEKYVPDYLECGEWLPVDEKNDAWDCSLCGAMVGRKTNYCPRCGRRMR